MASSVARWLIRLYPRAWRDRYGDEMLTLVDQGLDAHRTFDLMLGAADAWLSPQIRAVAATPGATVINALRTSCQTTASRVSTRDSLVGAAVMVGVALALVVIGVGSRRAGWLATGEALTSVAFPISMVVSLPFTYLKGHSWRAQAAVIGVMLSLLIGASVLATFL